MGPGGARRERFRQLMARAFAAVPALLTQTVRRGAAAAVLLLAAPGASAALRDGQPPPYVGTPPRVVERMLTMAKVRSTDTVMDLGSGDGRIVLEAARRFGARAIGVEMNGALVGTCQDSARKLGIAERATCRQGDIFDTDLSEVSVLTLYLSPEFNERLTTRILQTMRPGSRVVSHDFALGAWLPDASVQMEVPEKNFGRGGESTIMLFVVPANAAGRWRASVGEAAERRELDFSLSQQFQMLEGALRHARGHHRFDKASLVAERIVLEWREPDAAKRLVRVSAKIQGDRMTGFYRVGKAAAEMPFTARRVDTRPDIFH
jgi:SAM-dependent methyltransferase